MSDDKVIHLAFSNPEKTEPAPILLIGCSRCRNKTFRLVAPATEGFCSLECAACGQHIGMIGWVWDVPPDPSKPIPA